MQVLDALFKGIKTDVSPLYLLKDEIVTVDDLGAYLTKDRIPEHIIADIKNIFFIVSDLELPQCLLEAIEAKERIGIFVGAGVSRLMGLPLWIELADKAIDALFKRGLLSYEEAERIKCGTSPKHKMSIFHSEISIEGAKDFYHQMFTPISGAFNPYTALCSLPLPKFSLNIDDEFWKAMELKHSPSLQEASPEHALKLPRRVYSNFKKDIPIESDVLYQIHGSVQHLEEHRVITMQDYLKHYYREDTLNGFLSEVASSTRLIFLGCGMEEMEILGPFLKSGRRHLVVSGTYIAEKRLLEIQRKYFDGLNMDVHGYFLNFNGYGRLCDLTSAWVRQIDDEMNKGFNAKTIGEFDGVVL